MPAYSTHYPRHPRRIMTTRDGIILLPSKLDPFTSMGADVMNAGRGKHPFATRAKVEAHWHATFSAMTPTPSDILPKDRAQGISSAPRLQRGSDAGGFSAKHGRLKSQRKLNLRSSKSNFNHTLNDNMDIDHAQTVMDIDGDVRMRMQSMIGNKQVQTSSDTTRREHGASQNTSSSATRLDDCITEYIKTHLVSDTIGPERVKALVKSCFANRSSSQTLELLNAVRTPGVNNKHAKRQGAKAVKKLERIHSSGDLSPVEATGFRALSARANYLAQDRPDLAFSTKELCR